MRIRRTLPSSLSAWICLATRIVAKRLASVTGMCLMVASIAHAAVTSPKSGYTKFILMQPDASARLRWLAILVARISSNTRACSLAYGRSDSIAGIRASAQKSNYELIERDDFDTLQLPGGTIDTRKGTAGSLPGRALMPFPAEDVAVTWLIQFVGPPMNSWKESVTATRVTLVHVTEVMATHLNDLRIAIEPTQDLLQIPRISYCHPSPVPHSTVISATDFQELRDGLK